MALPATGGCAASGVAGLSAVGVDAGGGDLAGIMS